MKALVRLSVILAMVTALSAGAPTTSSALESGFIVDDPLRYTFPIPGSPADEISFLIYSKAGQISDTDVQLKEIKDPNGLTLGQNKINLSLENTVVTQDGVRVTLKLDRALFSRAGDYRIILLIRGKTENQTVSTLATLTVNRPAAEINLDELKDHTIELERNFPGGEASGRYTLYLQETSGKASVNDLQMDAQVQSIYLKDSKVIVPGSVKATPQFIKLDNASANDDRGQWALVVNVSGIKRTGDLTSELRINSPGFNGSKIIPLKMSVSDPWGFPLSVIFLGVFGGFLTNYLSQNWKPYQLNKYKIVQLTALANKYRPLIFEPEKITKIQTILSEISKAEEENNLGNTAGATTRLERIEKDLGDFRKEEIKQQAVLYDEFIQMKAQVEKYSTASPNGTQEETERLRTLLADLNSDRINGLLEEDKIDEVRRLLSQHQAAFAEYKKERLERDLESLKERLEQMGTVPTPLEANKSEIEQKIEQAKALIRDGNIDDAREKLNEIDKALKALSGKLPRGAKAISPVIRRNPLLSKQEENAAAEFSRIQILEPLSLHRAGNYLHFQVEDLEKLIQNGDVRRWNFGDGGRNVERSSATIPHAFAKSGRYYVKVDILRGPGKETIRVLTLPITILPGQTEIELSDISSDIRKSEIFIFAIALMLASLTGLLYLYSGNTFGSLKDYLVAFLWGFGIDSSVRGFSAVLKKATGREA